MRRWLDAAWIYGDRRVASLFFFGFSSGLPLALTGATLAAWFTEAGASLTEIGLVSLVGLAYAFKFLWSPLVDRLPLPLLTRLLGRRRGWLLLSQAALAAALIGLAAADPVTLRGWALFWAAVVAFASATQDIAVDAYRTEILEDEQLGAGAAVLVFGYRVAMVTSGGGALILAGAFGWGWSYVCMAVLMGVGIAAVLINPEPRAARDTRYKGDCPGLFEWCRDAVIGPFAEFMSRPGWIVILLFVALYKYGDALLGVMAVPFYLKLGFSLTEVGVVSKGFGLAMTLAGALLGGVLVARYGIVRALLFAGLLQAASNLAFVYQAWVGYSVSVLVVTIGVENFTGGMGTTAFVAYLSRLCNRSYTATQYALLSSMMAAARTFFASGAGWVVEQTDWIAFFLISTAAAVPSLLLLWWIMVWYPDTEQER